MRLLFDINHPAHVHLLRHVIAALRARGHECQVVARAKDVTLPLLDHYAIPYRTLARARRGRLGQAVELAVRELRFAGVAHRFRPDAIIGSSVHAARAAWLVGAKSIVLNADNAAVIPLYRWLAYPLATAVVTPAALAHERHGARHITYRANHQLFYLHPNRFTPDPGVRAAMGLAGPEPYALVRLSALAAHHDRRARGIEADLLDQVIALTRNRLRLLISSERPLPPALEAFRLDLPPQRVHDALALAQFYLGDSQSMTTEAAVLGTPAFRLSGFVGRLSVIDEVERAGLAFGFRPGQERLLLEALSDLLSRPDPRATFSQRRQDFLATRIDPLPWFVHLVEDVIRTPIAIVR